MKVSRNRSVPVVAALAALGVTIAAVSCTGTKPAGESKPGDKTSGPAIAKGDKSVEKPASGKTPGSTIKSTPGPVAAGDPVPPPRPGAPLPPPTEPMPLTAKAPTKPVDTTPVAKTPEPMKPETPVAKAPEPKKPETPVAKTPEPKKPETPVAKAPEPKKPETPVAKTPEPMKPETPVAKAPEAKKPSSEADKILEDRIRELQLEREKRAVLVQTYVANAREAATANHWDEVAEWASKAVENDHNNADAQALLRQARKAQGFRDADIASIADLMIQSAKVKREAALFQVQNEWDAAQKAKAEKNYAAALQHLELALTIVQNDPTGGDWGNRQAELRSAIEAVGRLKTNADQSARNEAAKESYRKVKEEEARRRLAEIEKKNALIKGAMDKFEAGRYAEAETLLSEYVKENPNDANARQLMHTANRAAHQKVADDTLQLQRERFRQWKLDMEETTVPYHKILTWPSQAHWNRITELRKDAGVISEPVADSPETAATKNQLRTARISFSFTGAAFSEVVKFIRDAKQVNVVIDPTIASELESAPITLNLQDVSVETALRYITKLSANLTYVVQGPVIMICKTDSPIARAKPIIQVHAIGDLTVPLTNFIAPDLNLLPSKAEESEDNPKFGKSTEGVAPFGGADKVQELIQKNVADENYWSSEGVSIAPHGDDKLLVIASPEVQRSVSAFLNDLRAFSGLVVTIETRFLSVTDNFIRDIGVDVRGLGGASPGKLALLDDVTNGLDDNASAGLDNGGVGLPANASSRPSAGAFFQQGSSQSRSRTENIFDRALGTKITNVGGAVVQWTMVDDVNLSMILRAVEKTQEGRVLQAPIVTVFNTQRANITLVNQLSFIQDFDVEVAQTAFIADPIVGVIQDGVVLDVQPTVSHDRKYITLQLKPTIATLTRPIPTYTTSLGAFTTPVTIQIPELKVQRAATTVRVPDGGTVLLGGLKNINMADLKSETPWLSSIPFASFFLGRKGTVKEMDNLMVIVSASITDLNEQERQLRR